MTRRLSYAEKGKSLAVQPEPPRTARVKVPAVDNSELIRKHSLTLVGRITNPRYQIMWSLIPFFGEHWKVKTSPGIPLHLWSEAALTSLANDIDFKDRVEVTSTKARVRVFIDGLKPLIIKATLDFDSGEEVEVTLVYEKLEKHCKTCFMLDHEAHDCSLKQPLTENLRAPADDITSQSRAYRAHQSQRLPPDARDRPSSPSLTGFQANASRDPSLPRYERRSASYNRSRPHHSERSRNPPSPIREVHSRSPCARNEPSNYYSPQELNAASSYHSREYRRPNLPAPTRSLSHSVQKSVPTRQVWIEKPPHHRNENDGLQMQTERSASSRPHQYVLHKDIPDEALSDAMTEVREAMTRYTTCPDPTESAARRERFRLAEEAGEVEETAALMILGTPPTRPAEDTNEQIQSFTSPISPRVPALLRLGPIMEDEEIPTSPLMINSANVTKRRPGRPPGRRNITPSPCSFLGLGLRRRTISKTQPSPLRRKSSTTIPRSEENPRKKSTSKGAGPSSTTRRPKTSKPVRLPSSIQRN
ncbi:Uncharacterized protein Rs2_19081 [Raphanus sativus]|nr:Uncharacterized protein Rs2_19081 [Raphanus sativus]